MKKSKKKYIKKKYSKSRQGYEKLELLDIFGGDLEWFCCYRKV